MPRITVLEQSRAAVLCFFIVLCPSLASGALPAPTESHFYSMGQKISLFLRKDLVALEPAAGQPATINKSWLTLRTLGLSIVLYQVAKSEDHIIGIPIRFHSDSGAAAVLTREIVFKLKAGVNLSTLLMAPSTKIKQLWASRPIFSATFTTPYEALDAANRLAHDPKIAYAHPNFLLPKSLRQRSDPLFPLQWHMHNKGQSGGLRGADIGIIKAWQISKGSSDTRIAMIDTGFDVEHQDLSSVWSANTDEIVDDDVDNDRNGYVDDYLGWNFTTNTPDISAGLYLDHGTSVSGLAAALENGKGVVGACPKCSVIPIVLGASASDDAAAFYYASKRGADVISNSWGYPLGTPTTDVVADAIAAVATEGRDGLGTTILFAMNNLPINDCTGQHPDISSLESVIAVSGSNDLDRKVSYAAFGHCMDILAPTHDNLRGGIITTDISGYDGYNNGHNDSLIGDDRYTSDFGGTSASTAIVAGVVGLMLSIAPDIDRLTVMRLLFSHSDKIEADAANYDDSGFSLTHGYGRINAFSTLSAILRLSRLNSGRRSLRQLAPKYDVDQP